MANQSRRRLLILTAMAIVNLGLSGTARASDELDLAESLLDEALFDEAVALFDEAEARGDLSKENLIRLFAGRAVAHFANRRSERMEIDLRRLAAISSHDPFPASAPPPVVEAFARALAARQGPLDVDVDARLVEGAARFEVRVDNDPGDLVRAVVVHVRAEDTGPWVTLAEAPYRYETTATTVSYRAELRGPGGSVLARVGTAVSPLRVTTEVLQPRAEAGEDDGSSLRWWLVGGGAAVAGIAVAAAVMLSGRNNDGDRTDVSGPALTF